MRSIFANLFVMLEPKKNIIDKLKSNEKMWWFIIAILNTIAAFVSSDILNKDNKEIRLETN